LQKELIRNYKSDIAKHAGSLKAVRIESTFKNIPSQLAKEVKSRKFNFKGVLENNSKFSYLEGPIEWLIKAGLIYKVPICNKANSPLLAYTEHNRFALYLFDIGILGAMNNLSYQSILSYDYGSYKGYVAENFVLSELVASSDQDIFSWKEKQSQLEFVIDCAGTIIPIEVKSGRNVKAKSLNEYRKRYHPLKSFILSGKPPRVSGKQIYLPLYMANKIFSQDENSCTP